MHPKIEVVLHMSALGNRWCAIRSFISILRRIEKVKLTSKGF